MNTDFVSGQIDALRVAIIAIAVKSPGQEKFLQVFRELHQHLQDDLLARAVPDAQLAGIAAESRAIEELIQPMTT